MTRETRFHPPVARSILVIICPFDPQNASTTYDTANRATRTPSTQRSHKAEQPPRPPRRRHWSSSLVVFIGRGGCHQRRCIPTYTRPLFDHYWTTVRPILDHYWTTIGPLFDPYWTTIGPILDPYWTYTRRCSETQQEWRGLVNARQRVWRRVAKG